MFSLHDPSTNLFPYTTLFRSVFAGWKIRRARLEDREARRIGALQHEAAELMHKLRRDDASPREYYAEASRRSEEHTSELQSHSDLVCRILLEKKKVIATLNHP